MRVTTLIEDENHDVLGLEAEKGLSYIYKGMMTASNSILVQPVYS
jgi:hypothetical protein